MKNIILFFLGLFYVQFCHSQELPDLKAYGSDIGFNTNFVFAGFFNSNPGSTPFDLLYKRQKNNHLANRFGMKLSIQNSSKPNVTSNGLPPSASYGKYSNYFASISIGREIQKQITKKVDILWWTRFHIQFFSL